MARSALSSAGELAAALPGIAARGGRLRIELQHAPCEPAGQRPQASPNRADGVAAEQRVIERDDVLGGARIALPSGPAIELAIDAAAVAVLGQDHVQPPARGYSGPEHDIGAAAGHVGRDGDAAGLARLGNHGRLLRILPGIEHDVGQAALRHDGAQRLGVGHRAGPDQHGAPSRGEGGGPVGDVLPFAPRIRQQACALVAAAQGTVPGQVHDTQTVDGAQLARDLTRRPRHAAEAEVAVEKALVGDAGEGGAGAGGRQALLGLDELVQALLPGAVRHDTPGVFVDDLHAAVAHDVVPVALEHVQSGERLDHHLLAGEAGAEQAFAGGEPLVYGLLAAGQQVQDLPGVVEREVLAALHPSGDLERLAQHGQQRAIGLVLRDDEGRACLIDQHAIRLVHDGNLQPAQQQAGPRAAEGGRQRAARPAPAVRGGDAVLQVIEDELLVGDVGDVGAVRLAAFLRVVPLLHEPRGEAERGEDRAEALGVALGEVVVDGDDVHSLAGKCGGGGGQHGGDGLALAGRHLDNAAPGQQAPARELHVVVAQAEMAFDRGVHEAEDAGLQACGVLQQSRAQRRRFRQQRRVGHGRDALRLHVHAAGEGGDAAGRPARLHRAPKRGRPEIERLGQRARPFRIGCHRETCHGRAVPRLPISV